MGDEKPQTPDFDGFLAKFTQLLDRTPKGDDLDDEGGGSGQTVPYRQFFKANQRRKAAEEALQAMRGEFDTLRTNAAAEVDRIKAAAADQATQLQGRHQIDLGLVDAGLDGPGRTALRAHRNSLPEDARGDSALAWWQSQVEAVKAHRADPKAAEAPALPRTLSPYLPEPSKAPPPKTEGNQGTGGVVVPGFAAGAFRVDQNIVRKEGTNTQLDAVQSAGTMGDFLKAVRGG